MENNGDWDPVHPYGMDRRYDPEPGYARMAPSPGYNFDKVSPDPQAYNMPPMGSGNYGRINDEGAKGLGTASMIIGIVSLFLCIVGGMIFPLVCFLPLISSIVGLVLGISSMGKYKNTGATDGKGMAVAGIVTNLICLCICVIGVLIAILAFAWIMEMGGMEEIFRSSLSALG
jgi:hypothetical protein